MYGTNQYYQQVLLTLLLYKLRKISVSLGQSSDSGGSFLLLWYWIGSGARILR